MQKIVTVNDIKIGNGCSCFVMAEAGTTCNGDMGVARELVDVASDAGVDAIKFQTIWPEQISDKSIIYRYKTATGWAEENMFEMFSGMVFKPKEWQTLAEYTRSKGLVFFSTADYLEGVGILEDCDVPLHKMGSWDITYEPLIVKMAQTKKPIMVDLGPATLFDIARFVNLCTKHGTGEVILLHDFHTDIPEEMNLRNIPFLQKTFNLPVGFSSPSRNGDLDIMAITLGANVIEKRITLDCKQKGHHHVLSLEAHELKSWVTRIREAEAALGTYEVNPSPDDLRDAKKYYRSICTTRPIKKGEVFSSDNLDGKRPGTGIATNNLDVFLGRRAQRDLDQNILLTWADI